MLARAALLVLAAAAAPSASAVGRPSLGFWPEYGGSRRVELLDGEWQFGMHINKGFDSMDPSLKPAAFLTPNSTSVPSGVDVVNPGSLGPRGIAVYSRKFTQRPGPARLQFNACGFYCRVWVDGREIGDHRAGGYVGFFLDVPRVEQETERELFVLADNRWNATTAPLHTGGDFWHYGGLFRSVLLHDMPADGYEVWPWRVYVSPTADGYQKGFVNVSIKLTDPDFNSSYSFTVAFDKEPAQTMNAIAAEGSIDIPNVQVPSPRLWSLKDPQLHTITVSFGDANVTERFGLRWWDVHRGASGARISLNGKVVKLHGWNHHTEWPNTGPAPTDDQLDGDLHMMRAAGCNYIRGAHYPQDQRWLDRLDEQGVAMWEEALGPGTSVENLADWENFMPFQLQQVNEMLDMSMNHASIMAWGWFNEGPSSSDEACPAYKACSDLAHKRDPTRFRTWADNHELNSKCLDHASLISFNSYPSWYSKEDPAHHWNNVASEVSKRYPSTPFVISETGAGGVFEWAHNRTAARWTQKYQVDVIASDVDVALNSSLISGITLWHWCDFKANDEATEKCGQCDYEPGVWPPTCSYIDVSCGRPGGENHKGVVDFWRREKEAYGVVATKYRAASTYPASEAEEERQETSIVV